jgi:hypothetical protein
MKLLSFSSLLVFLFTMIACQKPSNTEDDIKTAQATVYWTGEIAADGCGFEVEIDGKNYLPEQEDAIPAAYKESESTMVTISYVPLQEPIDRRCGMIPQPRIMDAIRIISIETI